MIVPSLFVGDVSYCLFAGALVDVGVVNSCHHVLSGRCHQASHQFSDGYFPSRMYVMC